MNENTKVEQTIREMEERIAEINRVAEEKMATASVENADKISEIRDATIDVINEAINKIKETETEYKDETTVNFDELLDRVINKSREASEFTAKKIREVVEDRNLNDRLQGTSKQINDAFDNLMNKDNVKTTFEKAKEQTGKAGDEITDFFNDPEVKEKIDKTKDVIVDVAQAGTDALKRLLNTQGSDKGTDIPVENEEETNE